MKRNMNHVYPIHLNIRSFKEYLIINEPSTDKQTIIFGLFASLLKKTNQVS